jgi:transcription elongation factor Elf1
MTTHEGQDAGQEIDSQCLKCKGVTNHKIIAIAEEKIAKVECNVCGARHKYRPPKPKKVVKKKSVAAKKTPKVPASQIKAEAQFEKITSGLDLAKAKPYSMTEMFNKDDLIKHSAFGLGLITSIMQPNKIEVTFKTGSKLLICKLKNPLRK